MSNSEGDTPMSNNLIANSLDERQQRQQQNQNQIKPQSSTEKLAQLMIQKKRKVDSCKEIE